MGRATGGHLGRRRHDRARPVHVIEVIVHQNAYGKFSFESMATLVIVLVAGPVIYAIARGMRKRQNSLDLSMAMRELPPE